MLRQHKRVICDPGTCKASGPCLKVFPFPNTLEVIGSQSSRLQALIAAEKRIASLSRDHAEHSSRDAKSRNST